MRVASRCRNARSCVTKTTAPLVVGEEVLQPVDRVDVEMVRRFVEQQHVRLRHERPRQQHAPTPAARQRIDPCGTVEVEPRQHEIDLVLAAPVFGVVPLETGQPVGDYLENRLRRRERHVLDEPRHPQGRLMPHRTRVRWELTAEDLQKRRLAGTVAADDRDPLARFKLERHVVEQRKMSESVIDVIESQ